MTYNWIMDIVCITPVLKKSELCAFNGAFDDMLITPQQSCHSNYVKWEIMSEFSNTSFRNIYHLHFDFYSI